MTMSRLPDMKWARGPARPFIIPLFIPHSGCPHTCVFCDQSAITGTRPAAPDPRAMARAIDRHLRYRGPHRSRTEIAFYGGNFLGQGDRRTRQLLEVAQAFVDDGRCDGIRFSTRPDTINAERLDRLAPYTVSTIEIGAQSMTDSVLACADRGHTAADTRHAVTALQQRSYRCGIQMMTGLPGSTTASDLDTGRQIADMAPDMVRIYPTVVLKHSRLARWAAAGSYRPVSLDRAVRTAARLLQMFRYRGIEVIRLGLQADEMLTGPAGIVAGPYHPAFGHLVVSRLYLETIRRVMKQVPDGRRRIRIRVHPRCISRARGQHNANILTIERQYRHCQFSVDSDPELMEDQITVAGMAPVSVFERTDSPEAGPP